MHALKHLRAFACDGLVACFSRCAGGAGSHQAVELLAFALRRCPPALINGARQLVWGKLL